VEKCLSALAALDDLDGDVEAIGKECHRIGDQVAIFSTIAEVSAMPRQVGGVAVVRRPQEIVVVGGVFELVPSCNRRSIDRLDCDYQPSMMTSVPILVRP